MLALFETNCKQFVILLMFNLFYFCAYANVFLDSDAIAELAHKKPWSALKLPLIKKQFKKPSKTNEINPAYRAPAECVLAPTRTLPSLQSECGTPEGLGSKLKLPLLGRSLPREYRNVHSALSDAELFPPVSVLVSTSR